MSTPIEITAAGHRLAGRIAEPASPPALVVALHGGSYSSRYYAHLR